MFGKKIFGKRHSLIDRLDRVLCYFKYVVLAVIIALTWWTGSLAFFHLGENTDELPWADAIVGIVILGALYIDRFFCKYACPLGAALSACLLPVTLVEMPIPLYQVDAFTSKVFGGNPAAVCPLEDWLPDERLQAIAAENNLSETAFFVRRGERYDLRWFTPTVEVDLCGHATLASAFVVFNFLNPDAGAVTFDTRSGELIVRRAGDLLLMDFPSKPPAPCEPPPNLLEALGGQPLEVLKADYYLVVYETEKEILALKPNMEMLGAIEGAAVIVSAHGEEVDFVSRFFAPAYGIAEDPVTGSSHCTLIPFYAQRQCKSKLHARQVSARGGELFCEDRGDRVRIAGNAVLYLEGTIK